MRAHAGINYARSSAPLFAQRALPHFNQRLHGVLRDFSRDAADAAGRSLKALIIGGTFGRGEGRVRHSATMPGSGVWSVGQAPFDDLDILVVLNDRNLALSPLAAIFNKYAHILGAPVDVLGLYTMPELEQLPLHVWWVELLVQHVVLWGDQDVLHTLRQRWRLDFLPHLPLERQQALTLHADQGQRVFETLARLHLVSRSGPVLAAEEALAQSACFFRAFNRLGDTLLISEGCCSLEPQERHRGLQDLLASGKIGKASDALWLVFLDFHEMARKSYLQPVATLEAFTRVDKCMQAWKSYLDVWQLVGNHLEQRFSSEAGLCELQRIRELLAPHQHTWLLETPHATLSRS